ncbi:hypothetical protein D3C73_1625500 [compost metagenome]
MLLFVAPAVKVKVHRPQFARLIDDKIGANVTHPDIIKLGDNKGHIVAAAFFFRQPTLTLTAKYG